MGAKRRNPEVSEIHNITIGFSVEGDKKVLDRLLTKIGKLLYKAGIYNIYIKDDYSVDYIDTENDDGDE